MSLLSLFKLFRRDDKGAILVEMTLITPLMIALSLGVFEFGNVIHRKLLIEAGLRDAARYMARCTAGFATVDCTTTAQNIAKYGTPTVGTLRVADWAEDEPVLISTYPTANTLDPDTGLQDYRGTGATVRTVRVTTSHDYGAIWLLELVPATDMRSMTITITASHEERFIGY